MQTGDYGGPLYIITGTTQKVVGISSYAVGQRTAAPCRGAHSVEHTQIAGLKAFIDATILL